MDSDKVARGFGILRGLKANIPSYNPIAKTYVDEFHRALDHLAAQGMDIEEFRVPAEMVYRRVATWNERTGRTKLRDQPQVDGNFLLVRIDSVLELDMHDEFRRVIPELIQEVGGETFELAREGYTAEITGLPQKDNRYDFAFGTDIKEEDILTSRDTDTVYHVIKVNRGIHMVSVWCETDYEYQKRLSLEQSKLPAGHNIHISGGVNQVVLGNVEDSLMVLRQSGGNEAAARALETIKNAVLQTNQLDDDSKEAAICFIQDVSTEASKPQPSKAKLLGLITGLGATTKAIHDAMPAVKDALDLLQALLPH